MFVGTILLASTPRHFRYSSRKIVPVCLALSTSAWLKLASGWVKLVSLFSFLGRRDAEYRVIICEYVGPSDSGYVNPSDNPEMKPMLAPIAPEINVLRNPKPAP